LLSLAPEEAAKVLDARELESLELGARERVTDTHLAHIRDLPLQLPTLFSDAARRARQAGFDGVELHFAHAYTMASFLSRSNTREDGYGGAITNRVKLPLEVYSQVRQEVGDDFVVGMPVSRGRMHSGGSNIDDAVYFGTEFARAGMDFLSLSRIELNVPRNSLLIPFFLHQFFNSSKSFAQRHFPFHGDGDEQTFYAKLPHLEKNRLMQ